MMRPMDRWRIAAVLAAGVLAWSAWYAGRVEHARPGLARCRALGAAARGTEVALHGEARVLGPAGPDALWVVERVHGSDVTARLTGVDARVPPGTSISVRGRFEPPDELVALEWHAHHGRLTKVWVSLPPLAWIVWILIRRWRFGAHGLEERT